MSPAILLPPNEIPAPRSLTAARRMIAEWGAPRLPLYLTSEEAEALLSLCAASPTSAGAAEERLLAGLGELLRAFWRETP